MTEMSRVAIVITHNRHEMLRDCVAAIRPQVDAVVVIDNASDPPVPLSLFEDDHPHRLALLTDDRQPPNIPGLWNHGTDLARKLRAYGQRDLSPDWFIAYLCDDTVVPPGWFDAVQGAMAETGAAAGCADPFGATGPPTLKLNADGDIRGRMVGWAFIINMNRGVVPDPAMAWWWCDTDMDWQARERGGMVMVHGGPDLAVPNRAPGEFTLTVPGLGEQTGRDRAAFAAKWPSGAPW